MMCQAAPFSLAGAEGRRGLAAQSGVLADVD